MQAVLFFYLLMVHSYKTNYLQVKKLEFRIKYLMVNQELQKHCVTAVLGKVAYTICVVT